MANDKSLTFQFCISNRRANYLYETNSDEMTLKLLHIAALFSVFLCCRNPIHSTHLFIYFTHSQILLLFFRCAVFIWPRVFVFLQNIQTK